VALAAAVLATFWPVVLNDFVNYDDPDYVTSNRHVQQGLTAQDVAWAFRTGHASNWHPLTWLSHQLDCQFYGLRPAGHHLTSLLLHAANTALLFLALLRLTGATWRSVIVAALFGLHPLRVESVAWISERKDVLSGAFWMLTLLAYAKYVAESKGQSRRSGVFYSLALISFALGLMSKPMLVTLPCVLLLLDYWPLNRLDRTTAPWLVLEKVPFVALAMASSVVTFLVQEKGGAVSRLESLPLMARLENALVSYCRYLGKTFWPVDLSVLYPHPGHWPAGAVWLSAAALLVLTAAAILLARRHPYLCVGWLWFIGTLVPVIGLVQVGVQSMADRYTYLPLIGVYIAVVWGASECVAHLSRAQKALAAAAALALLICSALTLRQIGIWKNSESLFRHAVAVTKDNYLAYNNLGFHLSNLGKTEAALEMYRRSIQINPNYDEAQNNIGFALAKLGRPLEAIPYYEAALRLRPTLAEAHNNLGNALSELGRLDAAMTEYETTLRLNPDHADAHSNLGIALAMKGLLGEAIGHFEKSLALKPNNSGAHSNLGNAYAVQRKFDEAIREYEAALQLNPGDAQAHNNLGNVLSEQGKLEPAQRHYEAALRLNPVNPEAHLNLGLTLLRLGQGHRDEAIRQLQEALRQRPDYAEALRQLQALTNAPPR
jgi:tetratricopeptide (TPR) repeat protein